MRTETPAKINLTLEIAGKRSDGYHDLATWIVPVAVYDGLEIEFADRDSLTSRGLVLPATGENLVIQAIAAFRHRTGFNTSYRVTLQKEIPIGAGLGGGSSDAAATLRVLNRLHDHPLGSDDLAVVAAELGSDVPAFLSGGPAWCTGRGEKISWRDFPTNLWVLLVKPEFAVATAEAYQLFERAIPELRRGERVKTIWGTLRNDLEPVVFQKYLFLPVLKDWLKEQPETLLAMMSGSGSTCYALISSDADGNSVQTRFFAEFGKNCWTTVCRVNPR
jgi:4-diphosphocytidyl-2-C-methyl-D-erythritol kinase